MNILPTTIQIDSKIDLIDILNTIAPYLNTCTFSIFEFDGILKDTTEFNGEKISNEAINTPTGLLMSLDDLINFSNDIIQTYDLILTANISSPKTFVDSDEWRLSHLFTLEIVDCGPWEIYSKDIKIINAIQNAFK